MALGFRPIASAPIGGQIDATVSPNARVIAAPLTIAPAAGSCHVAFSPVVSVSAVSVNAAIASAAFTDLQFRSIMPGVSAEPGAGSLWLLSDNYLHIHGISATPGAGSVTIRKEESAEIAVGCAAIDPGIGGTCRYQYKSPRAVTVAAGIGGCSIASTNIVPVAASGTTPGICTGSVFIKQVTVLGSAGVDAAIGTHAFHGPTIMLPPVSIAPALCADFWPSTVFIKQIKVLSGISATPGVGTAIVPDCKIAVSGMSVESGCGSVTTFQSFTVGSCDEIAPDQGGVTMRDPTLPLHGMGCNTAIGTAKILIFTFCGAVECLPVIGTATEWGDANTTAAGQDATPAPGSLFISASSNLFAAGQDAAATIGGIIPIVNMCQVLPGMGDSPGTQLSWMAGYQALAADIYWEVAENTPKFDSTQNFARWENTALNLIWESVINSINWDTQIDNLGAWNRETTTIEWRDAA